MGVEERAEWVRGFTRINHVILKPMTLRAFEAKALRSWLLTTMDVPYNKSGASSRAHYQLVMNVESNPADANQLLQREVDRIKRRFAGKSLSLVRQTFTT